MTSTSERRRYLRLPVGTSVRLVFGVDQTEQRAEVVDMSGDGMKFRTAPLGVVTDVPHDVHICRQNGETAVAVARVIRTDDDGVVFRFDAAESDVLANPGFWRTAEEVRVVPVFSQTAEALRTLINTVH